LTATYSGDPASSAKDAVRFLIGDTDPCNFFLQNAEIEYVLKQFNNTPLNAAIPCVNAIIAKLSRLVDESVGQVRISFNQKAKAYRTMLQDLRNQLAASDALPYAGGVTVADVIATRNDATLTKPDFTKHMMTNRQGGGWVDNSPGPWWFYGVGW
jgi:hypothetical protein